MKTATLTAFSYLILLSPAYAQPPAAPSQPPASSTTGQAPAPTAGQPPATTSTQPSGQTPAKPTYATIPADYKLVTGDKLRIEVYKDNQLSQSLQIRPDGKITLPLLGDIPAAGRTPTELRDAITAALREYITNPVVTVIVVESTPATIYIMGEVNRPGTLAITGPISILQALAMAGGFKDFAHTKDIRILRKSSTGMRTMNFNYNEAIKGNGSPMVLEPGDTVIVP